MFIERRESDDPAMEEKRKSLEGKGRGSIRRSDTKRGNDSRIAQMRQRVNQINRMKCYTKNPIQRGYDKYILGTSITANIPLQAERWMTYS